MPMAIEDELALLEDNVRKLAERTLAPHVEDMEHRAEGLPPPEVVAGLEDLGLLALALPDAAGGDEAGPRALARVVGALAETSPAVATLLLAHAFAQRLVARAGDGALARIAVDGDGLAPLLAYPLYAEPTEAGRHAIQIPGESQARVTGRWELVVNAPIAHRLALPIQPVAGGGAGLVLVDAGAPGVHVGEPVRTLGMRGCPVADVRVKDLPIDPGQWIGGPSFGAALVSTHREMRAAAVALSAGIARASLRTAVAYARERVQGGRPIIEHQEVRRMLGDMMSGAELGTQAAQLLCEEDLTEAASMGWFLRARAAAAHATCDGVQVLGGNGYMEDYGQERCMRDAKQAQCLLGRHEALHQDMLEGQLAEVSA